MRRKEGREGRRGKVESREGGKEEREVGRGGRDRREGRVDNRCKEWITYTWRKCLILPQQPSV